ncbi:MAG: hypothetical protein KBT39_02585 [Bacteroidales bacterium]|nr:hypothetical protein [Bacteroidales bacterium]
MSKEYYKRRIIDLRAQLTYERESKKKDNAYYAERIKNEKTVGGKASYRKSKVDRAASHDRKIESLKYEIEKAREQLKREK